jgi:hypothetical protein
MKIDVQNLESIPSPVVRSRANNPSKEQVKQHKRSESCVQEALEDMRKTCFAARMAMSPWLHHCSGMLHANRLAPFLRVTPPPPPHSEPSISASPSALTKHKSRERGSGKQVLKQKMKKEGRRWPHPVPREGSSVPHSREVCVQVLWRLEPNTMQLLNSLHQYLQSFAKCSQVRAKTLNPEC